MGFGTLFVGYFLLLNVGYTYYTDALAAAIMLYAFYRLSSINKPFRRAAFAAGAFLVFGLSELILSLISSLGIFSVANLLFTIFAMRRHLTLRICEKAKFYSLLYRMLNFLAPCG